MNKVRRAAAVATAGALLAGGAVVATAGQASAEPSLQVTASKINGVYQIDGYVGGDWAGSGQWSNDPSGSTPGDAIRAHDGASDGYGLVMHLSTGRTASTRGHSAPYTTSWKTGNLPEGKKYKIWLCVVKGSSSSCSNKVTVTA